MNLSNVFGTTEKKDSNDENSSAILLLIIMAMVLAWGWLSPPLIFQFLVLALFGVAHTMLISDVATTTTTSRVSKDDMQEDEDDFCHLKYGSDLFVSRFNFGIFGSI